MPFVRKRKTASGPLGETFSTTLVESYRDGQGRPRQRVLANMHGEETPLGALAKLAAMRAQIREEQAKHKPTYESWMAAVGTGRRLTKDERRLCDAVVKHHRTLETRLAKINREGAAIKKHCTASAGEIQGAIRDYKNRLKAAQANVSIGEIAMAEQRRTLRRLLR